MAVDGVENPGEEEAEHGSQEEHPEDHFLLHWGDKVDVGPEHVHDAQDQEEQETWMGGKDAGKWGNINCWCKELVPSTFNQELGDGRGVLALGGRAVCF
ncbi:hypothetical protein chiPu_0030063 [Chiloscyllium punctatum]|uniref:Uncharacterized protein n=1 Tax=Chiloscyllium punctatum TaxID=137246 RepID=A0A401TU67_CHIPU|nr:hypothetical protein [Chiloscyllium punctatum]